MWDSGSYQDIIPGQSPQKANTEPEVHDHIYWECGLLDGVQDVHPHFSLSQTSAEATGAHSEWGQRAQSICLCADPLLGTDDH